MAPPSLHMVSPDVFRRAPAGCGVVGRTFLVACAHPGLFGFFLWGAPTVEDIRALVRLLTPEDAPAPHPHDSVVDMGAVTLADPAAYAELRAFLADHRGQWMRQVRQQAVVMPEGVVGAVVAGFYAVHPPPYPVIRVPSLRAALDHLGEPDWLPILASAVEHARVARSLVVRVRDMTRQTLRAPPSLLLCARQLGVSPRTLQRHLALAGTSLQMELGAARVQHASQLLLSTDDKVAAIAHEVGCSSLQHLVRLFRKHMGCTPTAFREQHRAPAT